MLKRCLGSSMRHLRAGRAAVGAYAAVVDGSHDLGGVEGFGPVDVEPDEPVFHYEWERRMWGLTMASFAMGLSNGGQFRRSIERMSPDHYLTSRYYEHWLTGVATRLVETGRAELAELERLAGGAFPLSEPEQAGGGDATRAERSPADGPLFVVGSSVRVRNLRPSGHTRCPTYVRGRLGTVVRLDGSWSVPDVEAYADDRQYEQVYCVRFAADELWANTTPSTFVHVDLWERYLEAA